MNGAVVVEPGDPCDRCGHESRQHADAAAGSMCLVGGRGDRRPHRACLCDGFFPVPPKAEERAS